MATYDSLSQEEKDLLAAYTNLIRSWSGEQARSNNHADAINDDWNAQIVTIVGSLDAGEVIPNASGLSGSASLTEAEVTTLTSHVQNILLDMSTHTSGFNTSTLRQAWTKAAGATNMIG